MRIKGYKKFKDEPVVQQSFDTMVDDDMMSPEEAGFMKGYEEAG